jgi:hypothetical protein
MQHMVFTMHLHGLVANMITVECTLIVLAASLVGLY